jgi:ankyrin repeat protein
VHQEQHCGQRSPEAASSGDATVVKHLALHDPGMLLGTTPQGNTCLHISSRFGHLSFCTELVALNRSLLSSVNAEGETPPLTATVSAHATLALFLFSRCRDQMLREAILKQDKQGCNALHHAIRSGHRELELLLREAEPAQSKALNKYNESPMFITVCRNYDDILKKLFEIPDSAHAGAIGMNTLHAAVRNGYSG